MTQSGFIAGALLAGFVLWLAATNRLGAYADVLWGATAQPPPSLGSGGGAGSPASVTGGSAGQDLGEQAGNFAIQAALAAISGGIL